MFYTYSQNNSGGSFIGPALYVVVEADNSEEADSIAEKNGLYFDGCEKGADCDCCGDRWRRAWVDSGKEKPMIYDEEVSEETTNVGRFAAPGSWVEEAGAFIKIFRKCQ